MEEALYDSVLCGRLWGLISPRARARGDHDLQVSASLGSPPAGRTALCADRGIFDEAGPTDELSDDHGCHLINASCLTKSRTKERNSEMYQTKNGKQWYFDMKDHEGPYWSSWSDQADPFGGYGI